MFKRPAPPALPPPSQAGMSLIEVMVAFGLMSILMYGMLSLTSSTQTEVKAINEKIASLEFEKILIDSLLDGSLCTANLTHPDLNENAPYILDESLEASGIELDHLYANLSGGSDYLAKVGEKASPNSESLRIESIKITDIRERHPRAYNANLVIAFNRDSLTRFLPPLTLRMSLYTDQTNQITTCDSSGVGDLPFAVLCVNSCGGRWPNMAGGWGGLKDVDDLAYGSGCTGTVSNNHDSGSTKTVLCSR